jgi:hypothetical protein
VHRLLGRVADLAREEQEILLTTLRIWLECGGNASAAARHETLADERAGRRLTRAIQGKGAFRRFKDELHEEYPDLLPAWYAFRDVRTKRRAVQWLADNSLIGDDAASCFLAGHPDPDLP